jgi:hypothetical protein
MIAMLVHYWLWAMLPSALAAVAVFSAFIIAEDAGLQSADTESYVVFFKDRYPVQFVTFDCARKICAVVDIADATKFHTSQDAHKAAEAHYLTPFTIKKLL